MKIAWIVPGFSSDERDGCIPALRDLARVMAARHDLHVFALRYPYRRDRYSVFGATVQAMGGGHRGRWTLPGVWQAMLSAVTHEHRRARFDVLHAFWAWEPGVIAAWLKRQLGVRTIISLAGGELVHLPEIDYGLAGRAWLIRVVRWALRNADVVTAGSTGLVARCRHATTAAAEFAPLGVDVKTFAPEGWQREISPTIINVGSLEPVKAQADLIRAFRFVIDREPKARLVIAGDGSLRGRLEALVREEGLADRVEFAGEVRHEELAALYHAASVYAQTSRHEAQGMAVLEAAACGLPIVGTPVGALADLAPEAAVTSPHSDPLRLAQVILSLLDDPERRRALSRAVRARVEAVYSLDAAVDRFEGLYSVN